MLLQRVFSFVVLIGLSLSLEITRQKRSAKEEDDSDDSGGPSSRYYMPFPLVGTYAGLDGAFAGAGSAFPFGFMNPFSPLSVPVIQWKIPKPWYEGPNVCKKRTDFDCTELLNFLGDDFGQSGSKKCEETKKVRKCLIMTRDKDGKGQIYGTEETCCDGYVRSMNSPGCVKGDDSVTPETPGRYFYSHDSSSYNMYGSDAGFRQ